MDNTEDLRDEIEVLQRLNVDLNERLDLALMEVSRRIADLDRANAEIRELRDRLDEARAELRRSLHDDHALARKALWLRALLRGST